MLFSLKKINSILGINKDIIWSIYNKLWTAVKGPLTVVFIIKFLELNEQGLWYTFISLGALKVFAELGFTSIITQFVSHEFSKLYRKNNETDFTSPNSDKFFSLIRFSIRLYIIIIPVAIIAMIVIGAIYFKNENRNILYIWTIFSLIGGLTLLLSLFQAIYKGLDKVKVIEKNILLGSFGMGIGNLIFLSLNFKLWTLVLSNGIGLFLMLYNLYRIDIEFWQLVFSHKFKKQFKWGKEIINLQWRYAVSWASGYFIFNLIIPVLYKYESAIVAGKYGITFAIISAAIGVSQAWTVTKIPKFNMLIAKNEKNKFNTFFKKSLLQSLTIQLFISLFLVILFFIFSKLDVFSERFLGLEYIIILLLIQIPIQIVNILAIYLRAHKEEPYMVYSIINALFLVLGLFLVLKNYDLYYFLGYLLIIYFIVLLPYALYVFYKKKNEFSTRYF